MTLDYIINPCALDRNQGFGINLQNYRKAVLGQLFILFLIYFAGQIFKTIKTRQYISQKEAGENPQPLRLPWNQKQWSRNFPVIFANNAVCMGFSLLFNPNIASIVLAYTHLVGFILNVVGQLRMNRLLSNIGLFSSFIYYVVSNGNNIGLMLNGIVGINNATQDKYGICQYRLNTWA